MMKKINKILKWDKRSKFEKTLIILGLIIFPVIAIGLIAIILGFSSSIGINGDKLLYKRHKKQTLKIKKEIQKAKAKTEDLLVKKQKELQEIKNTNEEATNIITDIRNASTPHDLDKLRERINSLGK